MVMLFPFCEHEVQMLVPNVFLVVIYWNTAKITPKYVKKSSRVCGRKQKPNKAMYYGGA